MTIYKIPIPCVTEIYIEQFRKLIEFDMLKPDRILGLIKEDLTTAVIMDELFGGL